MIQILLDFFFFLVTILLDLSPELQVIQNQRIFLFLRTQHLLLTNQILKNETRRCTQTVNATSCDLFGCWF